MRVVALVMAGGAGRRMRESGLDRPKPLVEIAGRTLLERNVAQLRAAGLHEIVVSVAADAPEIRDYLRTELTAVTPLVETEPRGNVGAAGLLETDADAVVVVCADNLTDLDLSALVEHHERERAALTLASHDEPFRLPYGRLTLADGMVTAYDEKPELSVTVCSGLAVLGRTALAACDRALGLVDLAGALLALGDRVVAFRHHAHWIDVNDADSARRAEAMLAEHPDRFA